MPSSCCSVAMSRPPDRNGLALAELQRRFAAALSVSKPAAAGPDPADIIGEFATGPVSAAERLRIYQSNVTVTFRRALEHTYPVVHRRVGDDYFSQLARDYRAAHPSRHGDLHWVGRDFSHWLLSSLQGSGYEWLADLARLEWACEESLQAAGVSPVGINALTAIAPERMAQLRFVPSPSLRCVDSPYPIWSIWSANQPGQPGEPVALDQGAEHVLVLTDAHGLGLYRVSPTDLTFIRNISRGDDLSASLDSAGLDADELPRLLGWLFGLGAITGLY